MFKFFQSLKISIFLKLLKKQVRYTKVFRRKFLFFLNKQFLKMNFYYLFLLFIFIIFSRSKMTP